MISNQIEVGFYVLYKYYSPTKDGESPDRTFNRNGTETIAVTKRLGIFEVLEILDAGVAYSEEVILKWYRPETDKEKDRILKTATRVLKVPRMVLDKGTSMEIVPLSFRSSPYFSIENIYSTKNLAKMGFNRLIQTHKDIRFPSRFL